MLLLEKPILMQTAESFFLLDILKRRLNMQREFRRYKKVFYFVSRDAIAFNFIDLMSDKIAISHRKANQQMMVPFVEMPYSIDSKYH